MGGCGSAPLSPDEEAEMNKNKEVEVQNMEDAKKELEKIKLLLLGAGESGKSTVFKQMKKLYGSPPSDEERRQITNVVYTNILMGIKALCDHVKPFGYEDMLQVKDSREFIIQLPIDAPIDTEIATHIKRLWADPAIQATWLKRSKFQIYESVKYFFEKIDQVADPEWLVDTTDMLMARVRTTGIVEETYTIEGATFCMFDVGGQRNERKKWIHCFEDVTAVIYVAALSEFDQSLYEDNTVNRMMEAILLFDEVCNNKYFTSSSMILFLNKRDLFEIKIREVDIKTVPHFSDYDGLPNDFEDGYHYFLQKFLSKNKTPFAREIYHHVTCATDTENVRVVFSACKDIILRANMSQSGFA